MRCLRKPKSWIKIDSCQHLPSWEKYLLCSTRELPSLTIRPLPTILKQLISSQTFTYYGPLFWKLPFSSCINFLYKSVNNVYCNKQLQWDFMKIMSSMCEAHANPWKQHVFFLRKGFENNMFRGYLLLQIEHFQWPEEKEQSCLILWTCIYPCETVRLNVKVNITSVTLFFVGLVS